MMKRLLLVLLIALPAMAGPRDWTFYPPRIPIIDPPQVNTFCAANATCSITGAWTFASLTTASLTDSGLTAGNCVQATTGGLLTTVGSSCGTSSGTVTTTGSPASGNLTKFSGALSVTNADLTGDVTTSGGVATTLATVATAATNTKVTYNAKGLVTSGTSAQLASADFANQGTTTTLLHGNAAGNPSFSQVSLANDVTGNLAIGSIAPGSNGQCAITSGGGATWGSCAGTAGEQLLSINSTTQSVNANTASFQTMQSAQSAIGAGTLNVLGKTIRVKMGGSFIPVNTTETIAIGFTPGSGSPTALSNFVPNASGSQSWGWSADLTCFVTQTGSNGTVTCVGTVWFGGQGGAATSLNSAAFPTSNSLFSYTGVNLTTALTPNDSISFTTASGSNTGISAYFIVEQLN